MFFELAALIFLLGIIVYFVGNKIHEAKGLPPGPWSLPLLGHLPLLGFQPHKKLLAWSKIYGPIFFIRFGSSPSIVLTDTKIIKEAFASPAFAGRAEIKCYVEAGAGQGLVLASGPAHTELRQECWRILKNFGLSGKVICLKIQDEVQSLVEFLSGKEDGEWIQVKHLFNGFVVNILWTIVMSKKFDRDDPQVHRVVHLLTTSIVGTKGKLPKVAMLLPSLGKWFPKLSGHNDTVAGLKEIYDYVDDSINERKLTWVKGQPRDFTDAYFDKVAETMDESSVFHAKHNTQKYATSELFMAATDTTSSALEWFMYYLGKNLPAQRKLQTEIDTVIGRSALPNMSHRPLIPFTEAFIQEIMRISSLTPLGVFHRTLEDVEFHKFKIPADTIVISNLYGIHHDEEIWGDPENFRPERFLGEEEGDGKERKIEDYLPFSYGRRNCLGEGLARDELFLFVTSLCQRFTIFLEPGTPELIPKVGVTLCLPPFRVQFVKRS